MRSINCLTTILFAAMTFVAAQAQTPQLATIWGEGSGASNGDGGNLQGSVQTGFGGAATFSVTFTNGQKLGQNGSKTGTCSLEDGVIQITTSVGTITMDQVGTSCNVTQGASPNTLNATFLVTGATGNYAGMTGAGSLVIGFSSSQGTATGLIRMDAVLK